MDVFFDGSISISSIISVSFALMFDVYGCFLPMQIRPFHIIGMILTPLSSWFLISGKRSKSFLPEIPFRYFTITVMDNFGEADLSSVPVSLHTFKQMDRKALIFAISCTVPLNMPRPSHLISSAGISLTIPP